MNTRKHLRKFYNKLVFFTSNKRYHRGFLNNISLNEIFLETQDILSNGQVLTAFLPGRKLGKGAIIHCEVVRSGKKGVVLKFKKNMQAKSIQYV